MKLRVENEKGLGEMAAMMAPFLKTGDVLTLKGDLGAGKTAFARALINALPGDEEEVPSPTFTLVQTYERGDVTVWHFDLYRLKEETKDILELGWEDARRFGVSVVEWADRLGGLLPKDRLEIEIKQVKDSENSRDIVLTPHGAWQDRLKGF